MKLEFANDKNIAVSDKEPGSYFNVSDRMVVLRMPDLDELRRLWTEFGTRLRSELETLMVKPFGELVAELGKLGFREKFFEERKHVPYGMITAGSPAKSCHFTKGAMARALLALELVPAKTPHGKPRQRVRTGDGSVEDYIGKASSEDKIALIKSIVTDMEDIGSWMRVTQGSRVGWIDLHKRLMAAEDAASFLNMLAADTDRLMGEADKRFIRYSPDDKIVYAPSWFSQFLATKGVWLWPARYVGRMTYLFPARLGPLITRMSVGAEFRDLADQVYNLYQKSRHSTAQVSMRVFAAAGLSGNSWDPASSSFRWYPLAAFKERAHDLSASLHLRTSINAVYKLAVQRGGGEPLLRNEAPLFLTATRIGLVGVDAFNWTDNPTPRNTIVASRLLGGKVTEIPEHVRSWANQFRQLLPLFQIRSIKGVEESLNLWLIFLMTHSAGNIPRDFQAISRSHHVHDLRGEQTDTFWDFLNAFFREDPKDRGNLAISAMQKAFHLASVRDAFQEATNPFDKKRDRVGRIKTKRIDITTRRPLELEAWELIVRKNREDDYGFARSQGPKRYHYHLKNQETGQYENVFWPAEPIIVDIILNSGMRSMSSRWVDSGEGDEKRLERSTMKMVPNEHPAATLGRKECFLQLVNLSGRQTRKVIGQKVGINKTGKPFVIPWTDPSIVEAFHRMLSLQQKYNPIAVPVRAGRSRAREVTRSDPNLFPEVYPLFRDPAVELKTAVSRDKVMAYWKALLRHCQADVNALFGHEYPLIEDDGLVFDLHSLRVTMVSHLLEAGVSIELVRDLVGHATRFMTWHYNAMRSAKLHVSLQEAMERRYEAHERLASGDRQAILEYADEAIAPDFIENHIGAARLRTYAGRKNLPPFEVFMHGICPGGTCSNGGEKTSTGKHKPVWRERACSGCRYRVTGPRFKPGIITRINNLMAEMRLAAKRMQKLSRNIEEREATTGKPEHRLRGLQRSESSFKDSLAKEFAMEQQVLEMIKQIETIAAEKGKSADNLLLPSVPGFDPDNLGYAFVEVHEFELMHSLVKEAHILPAAIMEIPQGVESHMKGMVREILRVNNLSDLLTPLPLEAETVACIQVGDLFLEQFSEPTRFQQLLEGAIFLDPEAMEGVRQHVGALLDNMPSAGQIGHAP